MIVTVDRGAGGVGHRPAAAAGGVGEAGVAQRGARVIARAAEQAVEVVVGVAGERAVEVEAILHRAAAVTSSLFAPICLGFGRSSQCRSDRSDQRDVSVLLRRRYICEEFAGKQEFLDGNPLSKTSCERFMRRARR